MVIHSLPALGREDVAGVGHSSRNRETRPDPREPASEPGSSNPSMLFQDVRLRGPDTRPGTLPLRRSRSSACAIGIGVNSTIFSVVNGVMLKPFPYPESDRIVVWIRPTSDSTSSEGGSLVRWTSRICATRTPRCRRVAAFGRPEPDDFGRHDPSPSASSGPRSRGTCSSCSARRRVAGRGFTPDDDRPGAEPVVMLGHEVWQRRYNGDPSIIGRAISVNGVRTRSSASCRRGSRSRSIARLWVTVAPYGEKAHARTSARWRCSAG